MSHSLETAIAAAQSRVAGVDDSSAAVPGFDCSLDELNETFTEVANDINLWLDVLSSGPPEIDADALHIDDVSFFVCLFVCPFFFIDNYL